MYGTYGDDAARPEITVVSSAIAISYILGHTRNSTANYFASPVEMAFLRCLRRACAPATGLSGCMLVNALFVRIIAYSSIDIPFASQFPLPR